MNRWEDIDGVAWPREKIDLMVQHIQEGLDIRPEDRLLEVGCGTGWLLRALAPRAHQAVGTDFSLAMLQSAECAAGAIPLICGDLAVLPFGTETFDCVLCYFVLINNPQGDFFKRAVSEIMRVLKKNGRALIGQLPDRRGMPQYERAKQDYAAYCQKTFAMGTDYRQQQAFPITLFDRPAIARFLDEERISYRFRASFNPFYYSGQPQAASWRFDVLVRKG